MRSRGTLRYSPKRLGEADKASPNWWLILDCDEGIGKYYRFLYHLSRHRVESLLKPAWASHVTVIRDEEPPDELKPLWEKYAGAVVEFDYDGHVHDNGNYFWIDVDCPQLLDIRVELGLPREPLYPLHLSIGHRGEA